MTTTARGGVSRALALTALAGAILAAPTAASAATRTADDLSGTATYKSAGTGWDGVISGRAAGTNVLATAGGDVETFCVEYNVPAANAGAFSSTNWATGFPGKAADIATRHNDIPGKLANAKSENSAAQLAIWHLTDDVDYSKVPNAEIVARADQLVAAAQNVAAVNGTFAVTIDTQTTLADSGLQQTTIAVKVLEGDGDPAVAVPVELTPDRPVAGLSGAPTAVTGADGVATLVIPAPLTQTTGDITISPTIAAGAIWAPEGDQQLVVATSDVTLELAAAADVELLTPLPADPTPDPTPTADPTPTPVTATPAPTATPVVAKPQELPKTGALGTAGMVAGLLAVAGAATWRTVTLRRRTS